MFQHDPTHSVAKRNGVLSERHVWFGLLATDMIEGEEEVMGLSHFGGKLNFDLLIELWLPREGRRRRRRSGCEVMCTHLLW